MPASTEHADDSMLEPQKNPVVECLRLNKANAKSAMAVEDLAAQLEVSAKTALRYLAPTAQSCLQSQISAFERVCDYANSLIENGTVEAVALLEFQAYDETPMRLRVEFPGSAPGMGTQLTKIFAVSTQWALLIRKAGSFKAKDYTLLHGHFAVSLRAADSNSAAAVTALLQSCPRPLEIARSRVKMPLSLRIAESDSAPSNVKAERLVSLLSPDDICLHLLCAAHRAHNIADRCWELQSGTLSGIIHSLLCLEPAAHMHKLESAMMQLVDERLIVKQHTCALPADALAYRASIISLYVPSEQYPRKRTTCLILACLLNADWRRKALVHRCSEGCCPSEVESKAKIKCALCRAVRCLRPSRLCKANWQEWSRPMNFVGYLGGIHCLLRDSFERIFQHDIEEVLSRKSI